MNPWATPISLTGLHLEVLRIYDELDQRIGLFREASGLRCPPECGACCLHREIEATVLEAFPLGEEIFSKEKEVTILTLIEERENQGDALCVLYQPHPVIPDKGGCSFYRARPLACRLFGYASRRNKLGIPELSTCKPIKETSPHAVLEAEKIIRHGYDVPIYQDSFMRIAALEPGIGFGRLPINIALKRVLEKLFWKKKYSPS